MTSVRPGQPSRILHVVNRMDRGGAEMRTMEVLRRLDRRRFPLHFCALSGREGEFDDEIRRLGGHVHPLSRIAPGFAGRFRALLRRHRFDAVHAQVLYFSGYVLRLAAGCGVPVRLVQLHNTRPARRSGPARWLAHRLLRRWIDRYATDVVGVSRGVLTSVWGPGWSSDPRCRVVYNGVETAPYRAAGDRSGVRREFGFNGGAPVCLHVGRMLPQKNHLRLAAIFAALLCRRPDARLLVVGEGGNDVERQLRRRIGQLGIRDQVVLCGRRADVPRLMKAADALLLPSRWEGLPGVVQEACIAGTPVVASALPGVGELAERLSGIYQLALNEPDSRWAEVVAGVLDRPVPEGDRQQALHAFERSEFTVDRCAQTYCRMWQGLPPPAARRAA
jgi:glycosyltransferase involved in cell wall biosynthesis